MKKKVKFLVSIAGNDFSFKPGDEAVIDGKLADAWENSGVAEIVETPKK